MKGSTFKQCPDGITGTRNKRACPKRHGTWGYVFDVRTEDGKRKQVRRTGWPTEDAANDALVEALAAAQRGEWVDNGRTDQPLSVFLSEWLDGKRKLRHSTRTSYRQHIDNHLAPLVGSVKLTQLRPAHIDKMLTKLIEGDQRKGREPVSVATARRVFSTLRVALTAAVRQRRITYNPCSAVELPPEPKQVMPTWTAEQVGAFLRATADDRLVVLYRLALLRGLRRGELCGLRWTDLDLSAGTLRVAQAVTEVGTSIQFGPPKTKTGARVISLDAGTVAALRAHRKVQNAERLAWAGAYEDRGLVFAQPTGEPERPSRVSRWFQQRAAAAGVPVIRLHDARHTAASLALRNGASMKEVQELLGHSTYVLTADTYSHIAADTRDATAARVAAAVEGA